MTIYTKPRAELFAQDAPPSEIKPFAAWLRGLGIAFDETNGFPEMESFNGLLQALNGYIKYLEQNGFSEWSSDLEYPIGAGVRVGAVWYRAKTQNLNKPPATSQTQWAVFLNANDLSFSDPLQVVDGVIGIKDASTTQKGVARFATAAEVSNKTNVSATVNPANIAQMFSRSSNRIVFPDGTIILFGATDFIGGSNTLHTSDFSTIFPTACLFVQVGTKTQSTGAGAQRVAQYVSHTKSQFSWFSDQLQDSGGALISATYFAIGY